MTCLFDEKQVKSKKKERRHDDYAFIFCYGHKKFISHVNSSSKVLPLNFFAHSWLDLSCDVIQADINVFLIKDYVHHEQQQQLKKFAFESLGHFLCLILSRRPTSLVHHLL